MNTSLINSSGNLINQLPRRVSTVNAEPYQNFTEQVRNVRNGDAENTEPTAQRTHFNADVSVISFDPVKHEDNDFKDIDHSVNVNEPKDFDRLYKDAVRLVQNTGIDIDIMNVNLHELFNQTNTINFKDHDVKDKSLLNNSDLSYLQSSTLSSYTSLTSSSSSNSSLTLDCEYLEALHDIESYIANTNYEIEENTDDATADDQSSDLSNVPQHVSMLTARSHDDLKNSGHYEIINFNNETSSPNFPKYAHDALLKLQMPIAEPEINIHENLEQPSIDDHDFSATTGLLKRVDSFGKKTDSNQISSSTNATPRTINTAELTINSTVNVSESPNLAKAQSFMSNTLFLQEQNLSMKLNDYSEDFLSSSIDTTQEVSDASIINLNQPNLDAEADSHESSDQQSFESQTHHVQSASDPVSPLKSLVASPVINSETFTKQFFMQHPETAEKISLQFLQISGLQGDKPGKMTLQMTPESMGRMEVTFERSLDGRIDAVVNIHNADTYDLFRNDHQELRQAIADAFNVNQNDLNFNLNHQQQQTPSDATLIINSDDKSTGNQQSDEYLKGQKIAYPIDNNRVLDRRI